MRKVLIATAAASSLVYWACKTPTNSNAVKELERPGREARKAVSPNDPRDNRSPAGGLRGSSDGKGPFRLKGDYPEEPKFLTPAPPGYDDPSIFDRIVKDRDVDAAKQWMDQIVTYVYEDMTDRKFTLEPLPEDTQNCQPHSCRWYHMPWLHTPNATPSKPGRGRENQWGLTRELDFKGPVIKWPKVKGKKAIATDWGIGFYNEMGGYAIGKVFPAGTRVNDAAYKQPNGRLFPRGTVSFKILFTTAEAIPNENGSIRDLAAGAFTIMANINGGGDFEMADGPRSLTPVRHIQMDVNMRYGEGKDDWIFGTWVYDLNCRDCKWQNMRPLGVQWGPKIDQTIVFSNDFESNGFKRPGENYSRLNGPADNPLSSCLSCHARAQWPEPDAARVPFNPRAIDDESNKNPRDKAIACVLHDWEGEEACYRKHRLEPPCDEHGCVPANESPTIPPGASLDYSMQLALALRNRGIALGESK